MPGASSHDAAAERLSRWRERLIDGAVLGVPIGLIAKFSDQIQEGALDKPWLILWVVIPLAAITWLTWRLIHRSQKRAIDWRLFAFLAMYCSVFALMSVSELLEWRRAPDDNGLRSWVVPVRAGNWHYWLAPRMPVGSDDLIVVLIDPTGTGDKKSLMRRSEERLVKLAVAHRAMGIGFDIIFDGRSDADPGLCSAIDAASAAKIPIFSGYTRKAMPEGDFVLWPDPPALACLPLEKQGHVIGFADSDGFVRAVRLRWESRSSRPAFSVRIAQALWSSHEKTELPVPADPLLRFLKPGGDGPRVFSLAEVEAVPSRLNDRFLLIGLKSGAKIFHTPFGDLSGSTIHAYAIQSLLSGYYVTRPAAIWSACMVFAGCYILTWLAARGFSPRILALAAAGITAAVFILAAAAMYFWLVWLDVIYAVVAVWLLLPLLLVFRRPLHPHPADHGQAIRRARAPGPSPGQRQRTG